MPVRQAQTLNHNLDLICDSDLEGVHKSQFASLYTMICMQHET